MYETDEPEYEVVDLSPVTMEALGRLEEELREAKMRRENLINFEEKVWLEPRFEEDSDFLEFTKKDQEKIIGEREGNSKDREISLRKAPKYQRIKSINNQEHKQQGMEETEMWNTDAGQIYRARKIRSSRRH